MTLTSRYIYEDSCFVTKYPKFYESDKTVNEYVSIDSSEIKFPIGHSSLLEKIFYLMKIKIYTALPESIKKLKCKLFRKRLRNWLIENIFYTMEEYFQY